MSYPFRQKSAKGQPRPNTTIERICRTCGASFVGLAAGKTGERGIWSSPLGWFCSIECTPKNLCPAADPSGVADTRKQR